MALQDVQDSAEFDKILANSSRYVYCVLTYPFIDLLLVIKQRFLKTIFERAPANVQDFEVNFSQYFTLLKLCSFF